MSPWGLSHCHHTSWATLSLKLLMMAAFMLTQSGRIVTPQELIELIVSYYISYNVILLLSN